MITLTKCMLISSCLFFSISKNSFKNNFIEFKNKINYTYPQGMESTIIDSHAGIWYPKDPSVLSEMISKAFNDAKQSNTSGFLKGIIVPHAGYRYSLKTAAWAYININPQLYKRVIIMGPSHHEYFQDFGISKMSHFNTPFGSFSIDVENECKGFKELDKKQDENEHSIEMQVPLLKYIFKDKNISLIPIMVGMIETANMDKYGFFLKKWILDRETLFVISSDFCHWGKRFDYYPHDEGKIYEFIDKLDKEGMNAISSLNYKKFDEYLSKTKNTICGRNGISIFMRAIEGEKIKIEFVKYDRSNNVENVQDSSVSYASGLAFLTD